VQKYFFYPVILLLKFFASIGKERRLSREMEDGEMGRWGDGVTERLRDGEIENEMGKNRKLKIEKKKNKGKVGSVLQ